MAAGTWAAGGGRSAGASIFLAIGGIGPLGRVSNASCFVAGSGDLRLLGRIDRDDDGDRCRTRRWSANHR